MAVFGSLLRLGGGALLRNLGKRNATPEEDWAGAVATLGYEGAVRRYPQQAALYGGGRVIEGPGFQQGEYRYEPPAVVPQQAFSPPAQRTAQTIAFAPAMTLPGMALRALPTIPQLGTMAGRVVGGSLRALKRNLPTLRRDVVIASGFTILSGIVFDQSGNPVGKVRRRRRINPLNYRAAMRASRRLCAVQDLCAQIMRALPSRPTRQPRRSARFRRRKKC